MDNSAVLNSLHREHHSRLLVIARSILHTSRACDPSDAEDVVQQVWTEAWQRISSGQQVDGGWLSCVATARAKNWRRNRQCKCKYEAFSLDESLTGEDGDEVSRLDTFMIPEPVELPDPCTPALHAAMERLSPTLRSTVIAHYVDGDSLADIALRTTTPLGTVKRRLHDARTLLRGILIEQPATRTA